MRSHEALAHHQLPNFEGYDSIDIFSHWPNGVNRNGTFQNGPLDLALNDFSWPSTEKGGSPAVSSLNPESNPSDGQHSIDHDNERPPNEAQMSDLFQLFFNRCYSLLPSIHRESFWQRFQLNKLDLEENALLWAILAVAAKFHPTESIQNQEEKWLSRAITLFDQNLMSCSYALQTLQAGLWLSFQCYVTSRMREAWILLGKASQFAPLVGSDRIDSPRQPFTFAPLPSNDLEREEHRQSIWALLLLDRFTSCLSSWPLAINEHLFMVNLPASDDDFQNSRFEVRKPLNLARNAC